MDISIVIVSWNVKDLLRKCLRTIYQSQHRLTVEVFVVDNASTDGTAKMVEQEFSSAVLITNKQNRGFAAANNQAIAQSTGRYVLALNPDTELTADTLQRMIDFMNQNERVGIAGCQHRNADGSLQPSVRRLPTVGAMLLITTKLAKLWPNAPALRVYLATDFDYQITQPAPQVAGSFLLMRRELIEKIGSFDERFFIWFEEVDLCRRAARAGWGGWYCTDATIIHHGGQSFKQQLAVRKQALFFKSAMRYFKKHGFHG